MLNGAGLDINNCVANSFDGDANMCGHYQLNFKSRFEITFIRGALLIL